MRSKAVAILILLAPAVAQVTTGSISGYVLDPSERAVPNAAVMIADQQQSSIYRTETDTAGHYRVSELQPRTYSVSVVASGLASGVAAISLGVNAAVRVDFHLPLATRKESASIDARISALQTETSDLGARNFFDGKDAVPAPYNFGNDGRNILTGPGLFTVDVSLARRFSIRERAFLTVEAQAFDILNHTNFDLPQAFADERSSFGHIFSSKAPRQIQLALRLTF